MVTLGEGDFDRGFSKKLLCLSPLTFKVKNNLT